MEKEQKTAAELRDMVCSFLNIPSTFPVVVRPSKVNGWNAAYTHYNDLDMMLRVEQAAQELRKRYDLVPA